MPGPAATVGSMHVCPMLNPGTPPPPHVGGPVSGPGVPTVLIGGKPAAVMGDMCTCAGPPDTIAQGEATVLIGGKPAATVGSMTAHGGSITVGEPTVLIGTGGSGATAVMPVRKIPFPKITPILKTMASITGRSAQLREAAANQAALREAAESTEGDKRVYNIKWIKEEKVTKKSKVFKQITIRASVENYEEGESVTLTLTSHKTKTNEEGEEESVDTELTQLTGNVKDKTVEVIWEIDDTTDEEESNSADA